jgi:hypothetical protein
MSGQHANNPARRGRQVQNTLGRVLDLAESAHNLLTWVHPSKTLIVFAAVLLLTLVAAVLPARLLVFALGMLEFTKNLKLWVWLGLATDEAKWDHAGQDDAGGAATNAAAAAAATAAGGGAGGVPGGGVLLPAALAKALEAEEQPPTLALGICLQNLVRTVPSDRDLERAYRWRRLSFLESESQSRRSQKARGRRLRARLQALWVGEARSLQVRLRVWVCVFGGVFWGDAVRTEGVRQFARRG